MLRKVVAFSERDASLVASIASQAAVSMTNKNLLHDLREAYISTEASNVELKAAISQIRMVRFIWFMFVVVICAIGAAVYHGNMGSPIPALLQSLATNATEKVPEAPSESIPSLEFSGYGTSLVHTPATAFVMLRNATGTFEKTMVRTGVTTFDVIEILEGLKLGDQIAQTPSRLFPKP